MTPILHLTFYRATPDRGWDCGKTVKSMGKKGHEPLLLSNAVVKYKDTIISQWLMCLLYINLQRFARTIMKISVKTIPNAKKTEIVNRNLSLFGEETLKIKVSAPPVEGKANKALIEFLAEHFRVSKSNVKILKGEKSREKIIEIED